MRDPLSCLFTSLQAAREGKHLLIASPPFGPHTALDRDPPKPMKRRASGRSTPVQPARSTIAYLSDERTLTADSKSGYMHFNY